MTMKANQYKIISVKSLTIENIRDLMLVNQMKTSL